MISLIINNEEFLFEGICNGAIIHSPRGTNGFGYDPVFVPDGENRSFAEMSMEEKADFNPRTRAFQKVLDYILYK